MSGEKSKSSGEYGEKITSELFKLIGWENVLSGKNIACVKNDVHLGAEGNPRQSHGVDFIVKYSCPLVTRVESNVLISVKHRERYPETPKGVTTLFKSFLKDIAEATECYPSHELYAERTKGTKKWILLMLLCGLIVRLVKKTKESLMNYNPSEIVIM